MDTNPPHIFDRPLYLRRRAKASPELETAVMQRITEDVTDRLHLVTRHFDRALVSGTQNADIIDALRNSGKLGELTFAAVNETDDLGLADGIYDAIFSILDLHAINDVPGVLSQMSRALKPDGLLMLCFFAGDTLFELREAVLAAESEILGGVSPRVAPMIGIRELGGLLQRAGLALPVADLDRTVLRYGNAFKLMQEIKALGFANPLIGRSNNFTSRRLLIKIAETYTTKFASPDGRIPATLEICWANAWKPHSSQPQPLKPGSAKARLADALKVDELKWPKAGPADAE